MQNWKNGIVLATILAALLTLNLQAGNPTSDAPIVQIEILKNGQVFISGKPVEIDNIEQIAEDILKEKPQAIFHITRSIKTSEDIFLAVLNELKKADAKKVSVAVPTE